MDYAIGIDLGGTRIKGVAVSPTGDVLARTTTDTGDTAAHFTQAAERVLRELQSRYAHPARWIGLAAPGLAAPDGRSILSLPNRLTGLERLVWTEALASPTPIAVLNDAHAALVGEAWIGAAAGYRDAVLFTLGTGVGGAIMANGRLLRGHVGRAGHVGHICLDPDGAPTITGMPGGLEGAIGGCTVEERSQGRFRTTDALVRAHLDGDHDASSLWLESVRRLACGIASIINVVDPEIVVVGGGIGTAGAALFEPLQAHLDRIEWRPTESRVRLVPARLGDEAGAIGAARHAMISARETTPTSRYLHASSELLDVVAAQQPAIATAADWFAETILRDRMVHVFGSGHSRILVEELWPRYGSFPGFNPIVELSLTFHNLVVGANGQRQAMFLENVSGLAERILRNFAISSDDSALVVSSSGGSVVPVEMAEGFKRRGVRVVAIVSRRHAEASRSHHPNGVKLHEIADLVLDTGAPVGDAMVTLEHLPTPVAPGSTVGGALIVNSLKAEVAARLVAAGRPPRVLTAPAVAGAEASARLFEAAYDEHARRLAALFAHAGGEAGA
jgi:predicted NBD/HSP70 family sugar kinase/uncharacterized phosphosugar-binding protein